MTNPRKKQATTDILYLCQIISDVFDRFEHSSITFYGEKGDAQILAKVEKIKNKYASTPSGGKTEQ